MPDEVDLGSPSKEAKQRQGPRAGRYRVLLAVWAVGLIYLSGTLIGAALPSPSSPSPCIPAPPLSNSLSVPFFAPSRCYQAMMNLPCLRSSTPYPLVSTQSSPRDMLTTSRTVRAAEPRGFAPVSRAVPSGRVEQGHSGTEPLAPGG